MFKSLKINNSFLFYREDITPWILEYWKYIIYLLKEILTNNPNIKANIFFVREIHEYNNCLQFINETNRQNKNIWINFNDEHTLAKQGSEWGHLNSNIKDMNGNNYLIRISNYENLSKSDIIIDYSLPNIHNVLSNSFFKDFSNKHIYIFPSLYPIYTIKENRNISLLTSIIVTDIPRRKKILDDIKLRNLPHTNINNCFDSNQLLEYLKRTKILINFRQTDNYDTFEELRVLPALLCGVIIISETPPLKEVIPYNDYIIWTSYDNILDKAEEVLNNYDYYHNKIFKEPKNMKLEDMYDINYKTLLSKRYELV